MIILDTNGSVVVFRCRELCHLLQWPGSQLSDSVSIRFRCLAHCPSTSRFEGHGSGPVKMTDISFGFQRQEK